MLNLSDINALTNSNDGCIFSDLFKDVNGFRPRGGFAEFNSLEEFNAEYERLCNQLVFQMEEDKIRQEKNFRVFIGRIESIQELIPGTDQVHAIEILADSEDELEELKFYGYERIEWLYDLKFGSIKKWLEEVA